LGGFISRYPATLLEVGRTLCLMLLSSHDWGNGKSRYEDADGRERRIGVVWAERQGRAWHGNLGGIDDTRAVHHAPTTTRPARTWASWANSKHGSQELSGSIIRITVSLEVTFPFHVSKWAALFPFEHCWFPSCRPDCQCRHFSARIHLHHFG
jgi:hypothetical protein